MLVARGIDSAENKTCMTKLIVMTSIGRSALMVGVVNEILILQRIFGSLESCVGNPRIMDDLHLVHD